ncbi:MAG TPA: ribonuclease E inhibitor RraB [Chloroflexia bacterium]|nr:ribonuclease E inhibitor RraB [Chloroflexia bacterium]
MADKKFFLDFEAFQAMNELLSDENDLAVPPSRDYYTYFPSVSKVIDAATLFAKNGFRTSVTRAPDSLEWLCLVTMDVLPDENMDEVIALVQSLTDKMGGEFDGWQTTSQVIEVKE